MRTSRERGVAGSTSRIGSVNSTADYAISMALLRRARGALLRLVRRRALTIALGLALAVPAACVQFGAGGGAWWIEGLSLIAGATGLALLWTGLTGVSPDWIE